MARVRPAWIATRPEERRRHVEAAREARLRIKRDDLVRELDEEFGDEA